MWSTAPVDCIYACAENNVNNFYNLNKEKDLVRYYDTSIDNILILFEGILHETVIK